jgi:tRNA(Ile)-lysidine synthase
MFEKFLAYIDTQKLILQTDRVLLAVSGGVDSMVMADLCIRAKFNLGIGHINHQLRQLESDQDAEFVRSFCINQAIRYHHVSIPGDFFDNGGNMHQKARDFRYQWLQNICFDHHYDLILTAHHQDDHIESFFINLLRGSGIDGLIGISLKRDNIIRPMLFVSKSEILAYANDYNIVYREDSSNRSDKYLRNKIRNHLTPMLHDIDQRNGQGLIQSIQNIGRSNHLYKEMLDSIHEKMLLTKSAVLTEIDLSVILPYTDQALILFEYLTDYGYNYEQCEQMIDNTNTNTIEFHSPNYLAYKKGAQIKIIPLVNQPFNATEVSLESTSCTMIDERVVCIDILDRSSLISFEKNHTYLDANKVASVGTLRTWKSGDKMQPLGMKNQAQTLQDIFTNVKLDVLTKQNSIILEVKGEIAAILCWKTSELFKIDETTTLVLHLYFSESK